MSSLVGDLEDSFSRGRCVLDDQCLLDGSKVRPIYGKTLQKNFSGTSGPFSTEVGTQAYHTLIFFLKKGPSPVTATNALLRSSCGVLSRSYGFYALSRRFHCALSWRSHCICCAFTALALRFQCVCIALTAC